MGVFRALVGALGVGNAGLAVAAGEADPGAEAVASDAPSATLVEAVDVHAAYPSQSQSAALLDAALGKAREKARLAAS